jgi:hypothetical protein
MKTIYKIYQGSVEVFKSDSLMQALDKLAYLEKINPKITYAIYENDVKMKGY